ncbi:MAG: hypothetical protein J5802_11945 [Butyrivibrio sp.]|nr:hypothetical protein [Butyrivibrio sp.]
MKKSISAVLSVMMTLIIVTAGALVVPTPVKAADITFTGKVDSKTTAETLYLSTSGGTVEIKIDSSTDTSEAKFLFSGTKVTVNCTRGSDEYWHATSIKGDPKAKKADVDSSKTSTVKGKIAKGTTEQIIFLKTNDGTMEIKVDSETDFSNVKCILLGREVTIECARGSDAYLHAISVSDVSTTVSRGSVDTSKYGTGVVGTVSNDTTSNVLHLKTSAGKMEFVIDTNTDGSDGRALIPGQKVSVYFYRGNDAWNHTTKIVNESTSKSATVSLDERSKFTVKGKVRDDTNENTLFLGTKEGKMEIRLDSNTQFPNYPFILKDKKVEVTCECGSDGYNHAISVVPDWEW